MPDKNSPHPVMDGHIARVWYASRRRIESNTKFVAFEDPGRLAHRDGMLVFSGEKRRIEMRDVSAVALAPNHTSWVA